MSSDIRRGVAMGTEAMTSSESEDGEEKRMQERGKTRSGKGREDSWQGGQVQCPALVITNLLLSGSSEDPSVLL